MGKGDEIRWKRRNQKGREWERNKKQRKPKEEGGQGRCIPQEEREGSKNEVGEGPDNHMLIWSKV